MPSNLPPVTITEIPEDQVFQIPMTAAELSVFSLAMTVLYTSLRDGKSKADMLLISGMITLIANSSPESFVGAINSLIAKIDKFAVNFEEQADAES